jgi:hypothetical protein
VAVPVKEKPETADPESMQIFLVLGLVWTALFVAVPLLFKRSVRHDLLPDPSLRQLPEKIGPVPVQILFTQVFDDHMRLDCVQLTDAGAHEAGYPLTLRVARPSHPALDGAMQRTLTDLADRLAEVELRFAVRHGEPQVRIARKRTSMTFDLGAAA